MELESIRFFIKVIEQESFTKAAQVLNVPKSTISKAISRLEEQLSAKLIQRTTRNLTLTAAGRQFFDHCQAAIYQLEMAHQTIHGIDKVVAGPIRLTAPEDLGTFVMAPAIAELTSKYPKISFDLNYTDQVVDLVKDGYDLAVRIGKLNQSRFKAKKVGEISLITVASPGYLKKHKRLQNPKDLEDHECLSYRVRNMSQRWFLQSQSERQTVSVKSRITCNQMTSLLQLAQNDAGIAMIPSYLCQTQIQKGNLVHVLSGWSSQGLPVYLLSPSATSLSSRLKVSAEFLAEKIKHVLMT
ncbi:MAG: LysR family transcriptional regulator [Bdellovibrio sp.]